MKRMINKLGYSYSSSESLLQNIKAGKPTVLTVG